MKNNFYQQDNTFRITIPFILPSLNAYIAQCYKGSATAQRYKHAWENKIMRYLKPLENSDFQRVYIVYHWYADNDKHDKSNLSAFGIKAIEDVMVNMNVIENDDWCHIIGFEQVFNIDPKRPRIEVEITVFE